MKILVSGDVKGNFKQLFSRVSSIIKKNGEFDMLLCVGDFFSTSEECQQQWEAYVKGREIAPLPTFILGPNATEYVHFYAGLQRDGGELCENITCLGQRGVYTTSSGLVIAYLSGKNDYQAYKTTRDGSELTAYFTEQDISDVERQCKSVDKFVGVDILLTPDWPRDVCLKSLPPDGLDVMGVGAQPISRLAFNVRPRYHFAGLHNKFYERTPYRNHRVLKDTPRHVTRFIALGAVGNPDKKNRYLYAFSVTPLSALDHAELVQQPAAATDNPLTNIIKSQASSQGALPEQNFFFDPKALASGKKRQQRERGEGRRGPPFKKKPQPVSRGPCWFCLGGEQVEKHLVVSVGDNSYMALPKGGLVPNHVLILPIGHFAATTDVTEEIMEEMGKYKSAMRKYCKSIGKSCVIFERNFKSQHLQLQVVPVPEAPSDALRQAFIDQGKACGLQMTKVPPEDSINKLAQVGEPYFIAEFDEGGHLFTKIKGRFPLQFGREVLASALILNVPSRADWKNCSATRQEEEQDTQEMRKQFEPFDFTDDD